MAAGLGFKDFTTGEVLTAADVDGYLMQGVWVFASAAARDAAVTSPQEGNFAYLKDTNVTTYYTGSAWANLDTTGMTNPMTTTGDTIYSSSGSTPARLGIGSTGQVLTVSGGVPTWATPSGSSFCGCSLYITTSQSISNNTDTAINFNGELYDTDGFHDNSTNNSRITIPSGKGGYYLFTGQVVFQSGTTNNRRLQMYKNGSFASPYSGYVINKGSGLAGLNFQITLDVSAGDYFEIFAFQDNGTSLNAEQQGTVFQAMKVG
jgi:hypothetical protein